MDPRGDKNRLLEASGALFGAWGRLGALGTSWGPLGPPGRDPESSPEAELREAILRGIFKVGAGRPKNHHF